MGRDVATLSALALAVWQHGLRRRGASPFTIAERLEQELGQPMDPEAVSRACRELVAAGYARCSPFGYREAVAEQLELVS